ncbi:MAG: hypothetical protein KAI57_02090 [Candidatus Pacebacteria bacterium]|nr:hypothetical protein [Candidatus Paceibacterota bacterium]
MITIYKFRLMEEYLREKQQERIALEKKFVQDYKDKFLFSYLLPLNDTDFRVIESNIKMIKLLLRKEATNIETALSRKELVETIEPLKKDTQRVFDPNRKFSPIALGIFGFDSKARKTKYFIEDSEKANEWLEIMECFV